MGNNYICAVVVTYNRRELVEKCIRGILSQKGANCDVIVVDNGSTDGTEEMFMNEFAIEGIHYSNMGKNLGCATGTSLGIKKAVEAGYKYVWVMDDDVFSHEDTLSELLKADKELDGKWGILSSVAYWTDGNICEANRQKKTLFTFMKDTDYEQRFVKVSMVSLASMFINSEVVKKVGLPISEYYIYTEDYEFCSRVNRILPIYVVPASKVTHAMKVNSKVNLVNDTADRIHRYKYLYRNDVHCYRQQGIQGWAYLFAKFFYTFFQVLFRERTQKRAKIQILLSGYKSGFRFMPDIEQIRN